MLHSHSNLNDRSVTKGRGEISGERLRQIAQEYDAICILGPTASGKSRFAAELAGRFSPVAEILSADSRQVYRRMDIGTGKDLQEYGSIPYHLIDIADAGEKYNLFRYQRDFSAAYANIRQRGVTPIICGGSGLYIEAVTRGYALQDVAPDSKLRSSLERESLESLKEMLRQLKERRGSKLHNNTDVESKKRAIRAIEIEKYATEHAFKPSETLILPEKVYFIGIDVEREERNRRIDERLQRRLKEGMVEEVKRLLESGLSAEQLLYYGLEYKFITLYLTGEMGYSEMVERLGIAIHQFAKRQMTWFRGMERKGVEIEWIKI